jgi:predicted N-acetyltransferase YhbS
MTPARQGADGAEATSFEPPAGSEQQALSDFCYVTCLSDLAVRASHQKRGIGNELIRRTQAVAESGTLLLLLAAPAAERYYPRIGFTHPQAWMLAPRQEVAPG